MTSFARALCAGLLLVCAARVQAAGPTSTEDGSPQLYAIADFPLEGGAVLPQAHIRYATYGVLNATKSNAILLPSHYMADSHGYDWLIGPGKALDPARYFLVATEMFGNGHSSSPSNTAEPFHGPRFPLTTIRDNVEVTRRLLAERFGITHLQAVIGFSMGGQQAFQWAVSHPKSVDRIVVTAATAKTWPHGIVRLEGQIAAIEADPAFKGGDYTAPPTRGIDTFGLVWTGWLFSQQWWRDELWRGGAPPGTTFDQALDRFRHDFIPGADANDLILQMRAWEHHDVGTTAGFHGDLKQALHAIEADVLYMPSTTDLYFPLADAEFEVQFIPHAVLKPIVSLWGHTAGAASNPADAKFLNETIAAFVSAAAR